MTDQQTVAVVGATGQQGGAAVDALLERGFRVRGLTRDEHSKGADRLRAAGAEVVRADSADRASLASAFAGADGVFAMTVPSGPGGVEAETAMGWAMSDAAGDAGVGHIVYSSVGGAERGTRIPHFDSKYRVEQRLAESGLSVTVVRPTFFMDNLLRTAKEQDGAVVIAQPLPAAVPMQMVATVDIGRVAARVMLEGDWYGRAVEIAGDEVTGDGIAEVFRTVTGGPAEYRELPLSVLDSNPDQHRMFEWFQEPVAYAADFVETRRLDPAVLDLEGWLRTTRWGARGSD